MIENEKIETKTEKRKWLKKKAEGKTKTNGEDWGKEIADGEKERAWPDKGEGWLKIRRTQRKTTEQEKDANNENKKEDEKENWALGQISLFLFVSLVGNGFSLCYQSSSRN